MDLITTLKTQAIAKFLGWKEIQNSKSLLLEEHGAITYMPIAAMQYHKNLELLFSVVEMITKEYHSIEIKNIEGECSCLISCYDDEGVLSNTIECIGNSIKRCVFDAVAEFCEWYNNQKNN